MPSSTIPQSHLNLLTGPYYAVLTTIADHCHPENSIVWASWDGECVIVNTADGRRKVHNVRGNPWVALTVLDPEDPFRWIDVRGHVEEMVPDEDYAVIDAHAKLYTGADSYYGGFAPAEKRGTEERLTIRIRPEHVVVYP